MGVMNLLGAKRRSQAEGSQGRHGLPSKGIIDLSIRELINHLRAWRDDIRQRWSRRRYDEVKPVIDRVDAPGRVLFVRWDAKWGDSVVFSFVCRELKRALPDISVEVVTTSDMAPLFRDVFGVDQVHETRRKPHQAEMRALAKRVGPVDLAVHFSRVVKSRDMYLLSVLQARHVAGMDDSVGRIDLKLGEATRGQHVADKYAVLLARCGADDVDTRYIVPRAEESEKRVDSMLARRQRPYVCLNAYSKGRARSLSMDTCARLVDMLLEEMPGHDICMLSAPGKWRKVDAFCQRFEGGRVFALRETHVIQDNIALIARADALVSGITATVHVADGLGVPSFVLFPHDPVDRNDWHSRHPASFNLLARSGPLLDVNQLDWDEVEVDLKRFCASLSQPESSAQPEKLGPG